MKNLKFDIGDLVMVVDPSIDWEFDKSIQKSMYGIFGIVSGVDIIANEARYTVTQTFGWNWEFFFIHRFTYREEALEKIPTEYSFEETLFTQKPNPPFF